MRAIMRGWSCSSSRTSWAAAEPDPVRFWGDLLQSETRSPRGLRRKRRRVFTAKDADWTPEVDFAGVTPTKPGQIELRVKQPPGGGFVILLVNASEHPATITLTSPRFAGRPVLARHAGLEFQTDPAGTFTDHLEPFDVRLYSDRDR